MTANEEVELGNRVRQGDEGARTKMIESNLRLVIKIARDYEGFGMPLLDLISEGNLGLISAVDRFDPSKEAKFSTYAAYWIKQRIRRALSNQSRTVRLPIYLIDRLATLRKAQSALQIILRREPTERELADEIGISAEQLTAMNRAARPQISLDEPLDRNDEGGSWEDLLPDEGAQDPAHATELRATVDLLLGLMKQLNARERKILSLRFGLDGKGPRTLEEIGAAFGVTRERIRQVQNIALKRLRRMMEKHDKPPWQRAWSDIANPTNPRSLRSRSQ